MRAIGTDAANMHGQSVPGAVRTNEVLRLVTAFGAVVEVKDVEVVAGEPSQEVHEDHRIAPAAARDVEMRFRDMTKEAEHLHGFDDGLNA